MRGSLVTLEERVGLWLLSMLYTYLEAWQG